MLHAAGIKTANEHVHIFGERKPTHNGGSHVVNEDIYHVSVDGEYFKGKQVITDSMHSVTPNCYPW